MIKDISNGVSRRFVEKGILDEENKEICSYGLEIFISTMISVCMVLFISIICSKLLEGIIYLIFYCSLRTYAGGYHAKSHRSCILTFIGMYSLVILILHFYIYDFQNVIFLKTVKHLKGRTVSYIIVTCRLRFIIQNLLHLGFSSASTPLLLAHCPKVGEKRW